ncbi:hypothetical protein [Acinetobacter stercoris]|uniref:Alpha/beta hydrolase n=1 Tax=Acinetobacter stercoris TaxID=2126983 RepID=A0A2U3MVJ7_9GAMM|nr:hypothetical protein [Acinetobacter stercoris]SPL69395.1 hypothetical protein KPC_0573 [Acinetobacter stercoris]
MKIIFIHGMNQQSYDANSLKQHWINIFNQGIKQSHLSADLNKVKIDLAFYGDLIKKHQMTNTFDLGAFLPKSLLNLRLPFTIRGRKSMTIDEAQASIIPLLPHFAQAQTLNLSTRLYLASQLAKDIALKEFIMILNNFPKLHESLIHRFLIETYMYLANPVFIQEVHQRVLQSLEEDEQHIIVSHSLGTVIAYNLLQQIDSKYCIQRFITLGSPLAFRVIQSKLIQPIRHPQSLKGEWYNFYSHDDFLTTFPLVAAPFDFHPAIINKPISTFISKPHEIIGYLQHPSVIKNILEPIIHPNLVIPCRV